MNVRIGELDYNLNKQISIDEFVIILCNVGNFHFLMAKSGRALWV